MFRFLIFLLLAATANATSFHPELHECPVCGFRSVTMALASYSQFGEPARDLSDAAQYRFAKIDICPNDLFASWTAGWKPMEAGEKAKFSEFLKSPAMHLREPEKRAVAGHEDAFRKSGWFRPLWVRTCDEMRSLDGRASLRAILRLHYASKRFDDGHGPDVWEKQLINLFREDAIAALGNAAEAGWADATEKRIFAYLRAELTRQAGRNQEALTMFQSVIATEKSVVPDKDLAWISLWATEQSKVAGSAAVADSNGGRGPKDMPADDNKEAKWRLAVLLPAVRKAVAEGGIPSLELPMEDPAISSLPSLDGEPAGTPPAKPSFNKLNRQLYQLWDERASVKREDVARIYIRILRQMDDKPESTDYPAAYFLPGIAETEEGRQAIRKELDGAWESSFWKAACAYASGLRDTSDIFLHNPATASADVDLIFSLLMQRSDAGWKDVAIQKLKDDKWISGKVVDYLNALSLPETKEALDAFATRVRGGQNDDVRKAGYPGGELFTLQHMDDLRIERRMAELPIR